MRRLRLNRHGEQCYWRFVVKYQARGMRIGDAHRCAARRIGWKRDLEVATILLKRGMERQLRWATPRRMEQIGRDFARGLADGVRAVIVAPNGIGKICGGA